jgi:hypothetical protein
LFGPFAVLGSSFQHAIFIEIDTILLQDPELYLNSSIYRDTGNFLFRDLSYSIVPPSSDMGYIKSLFVDSVPYVPIDDIAHHQQNTGLVIIDKRRQLTALLLSCKLADSEQYDKISNMIYGEKELFFLGLGIMNQRIGWNSKVGVVGPSVRIGEFWETCSTLVIHYDQYDRVSWLHGRPLVEDSGALEHFAVEIGTRAYGGRSGTCIRTMKRPAEVDEEMKTLIKTMLR